MLDLTLFRENLPRVEEMLRQRGADPRCRAADFTRWSAAAPRYH